ncbi:MAG: hypothetical protein AAGH89_08780 [Verrucomicrobiota bacterium]
MDLLESLVISRRLMGMDKSLLERAINSNQPFQIETASGRVFDVPHRDFVSFSPKKTTIIISYEDEGEESFALVPLLTITSAMSSHDPSLSE